MAIDEVKFFRKVITKCDCTEKIPFVSTLVKEAVQTFYNEFDYYPEVAAFAPGKFGIMGDHIEYLNGNLIQAALPLGTVVVGTSLKTVKCKIVTTSSDVQGLRKVVFPLSRYINDEKVFPEWVTYVQAAISNFQNPNLQGFDAVIHSNIPIGQGRGSNAALQVAFHSFLEALCGAKSVQHKMRAAKICQLTEKRAEKKTGQWDGFTSSLAEDRSCVKIDCRNNLASLFDLKDIDILFLLAYPKFEEESRDRKCIPQRELEVQLAAKLLGLENAIDATPRDLEVLAEMEDPTRESLIEILQDLNVNEEFITEFLNGLFQFTKTGLPFEEEGSVAGENESLKTYGNELGENQTEDQTEIKQIIPDGITDFQGEGEINDRAGPDSNEKLSAANPPSSYIHQRIAELCEGKCGSKMDLPRKICEEINCLNGIDDLSSTSDLSVTSKLLRRLRHVVTENMRSLELPEIISRLDFVEFGTKLIHSHLSLKIDFDVSCPSLDTLVELATETENVYGAKMMSGGGTLTLLHRKAVEKYIEKVVNKFGNFFKFYLVFPSPGTMIIDLGVKSNPKSVLSKKYFNRTELMTKAVETFIATYRYRPTHGAFAPGIIDLIGDQTDYNHGLSLSAAISLLTVVVGAFNGTDKARIATTLDIGDEPKKVIFPVTNLEELGPGNVKWAKFIRGIIIHFKGPLRGFDCVLMSAVTYSNAISSHASLAMAFYTFLEELTGIKTVNLTNKVKRCTLAEFEFSTLLRGITHQHVCVKAKEDHALLFDSRSLISTLMPFPDKSINLVLTLIKKEIKDNLALLYTRIEECYDVARALGGKTLRCLTLKNLEALKSTKIPESSVLRAKHIILENERVLRAAEALKNNDFESLGEIMVESHKSLKENYKVTTRDTDFIVERSLEVDGVLGSKMPCYGRAICVMSLVKNWAVDDLIEYLKNSFKGDLEFFVVTLYDSCGPLKVQELVDTLHSPHCTFERIFPF